MNQMTKSEFVDVLVNNSSRLSMNARKALELIFVEGYSQTVVAEQFGVSRQAVSVYVKTFKSYLKNPAK